MKIVIFDGLDNTGKTTQIELLKKHFESHNKKVLVKHFNKPPENLDNNQKAAYQNTEYINYVSELIKYQKENTYDIVIIDRCWYSEYVYGQIYRERDELDLLMNIMQLESSLNINFKQFDVSLFIFTANSADFLVKHEDGLSISAGDIDKINYEKSLFNDIFNMSVIDNKHIMQIDRNGEFIDKGHIANLIWMYTAVRRKIEYIKDGK